MAIFTRVKKRFYQDSLKLMRVSAEIKELPGVQQAFAFMATENNKKSRIQELSMNDEVRAAGADDLVLIVECETTEGDNIAHGNRMLDEFENRIASTSSQNTNETSEARHTTLEQGKTHVNANLAVISVPGPYAAVQAMTALSQGMNVMLFSDNVSVKDEIMLKDYAATQDLLVMGPDCGTAIIDGVPLCFANVVKKGNIGVIGASGTGTQELTVLLDAADCGITHAIGTGGRDLSEEVEGRTMLAALKLLAQDPATEIIAIISKPPAAQVADRVLEAIKATGKPAVLAFLGTASAKITDNIYVAGTIEAAAAKLVAICKGNDPEKATVIYQRMTFEYSMWDKFLPSQKTIKGLFTGGTLASEAKAILAGINADIIDLGDDEYTRGALHPMIDPSNRNNHIIAAFTDESVAIVLCDVVLGYGSHPDPAGELAKAIAAAKEKTNAHKIVIAVVVGTEADPQAKNSQIKALAAADVLVLPSNQYAAEVAANFAKKLQGVQ